MLLDGIQSKSWHSYLNSLMSIVFSAASCRLTALLPNSAMVIASLGCKWPFVESMFRALQVRQTLILAFSASICPKDRFV